MLEKMTFMRIAPRLLTCLLWAGIALNASEIWKYSGPILTGTGDPSLRPAGLGNHFDLTITFSQPLPHIDLTYDDFFWRGTNPDGTAFVASDFDLSYTISWSDGSVVGFHPQLNEINFTNPSAPWISAGPTIPIDELGAAGIYVTLGPPNGDSLIICGDSRCHSSYIATSAPGTWTVSETPEPHALFMVPSGLLGLWAIPRMRQLDRLVRRE